MIRPRVIPSLLLKESGLVKTTNFSNGKYVGDPLNAVRIFNEKKVDELVIFDIDAAVKKQEPNYGLIADLAYECRMPFCYGGGITSVQQAEKIIESGVEKISVSSAALDDPKLVSEIAKILGSQSIAVTLDVKRTGFGKSHYSVFTHSAKQKREVTMVDCLKLFEEMGAGELIINSIDRDGTRRGYDIELIDQASQHVSIPLTALGGVGELCHFRELVQSCGPVGLGAGSVFVFKGRFNAVLIQYLDQESVNSLRDTLVSYYDR